MERKNYLKFLGTAGARYVVSRQLRSSGGIFLSLGGKNILIDPGPGALVRCAKSKPPIDVTKIDALILTHSHIDHANDINIIIDAMTYGGIEKKGVLFAPEESLYGKEPVVLNYVRPFLDNIVVLKAEKDYSLGELAFSTSIRHQHTAETYGLRFRTGEGRLSFLTDTIYFPELLDCYRGSSILVINVVRYPPLKNRDILHLCFDDLHTLLPALRPRMTILTHFGLTMLKEKPHLLARRLTEAYGIDVRAAMDGMSIDLESACKARD
jgi:phosphoribosyl 1,2-cyclic phosphodiesterase